MRSAQTGCGGDYPDAKIVPHAPHWIFQASDCGYATALKLIPTKAGPHSFAVRTYITTDMYKWDPQYAFTEAVLRWHGTVKP